MVCVSIYSYSFIAILFYCNDIYALRWRLQFKFLVADIYLVWTMIVFIFVLFIGLFEIREYRKGKISGIRRGASIMSIVLLLLFVILLSSVKIDLYGESSMIHTGLKILEVLIT